MKGIWSGIMKTINSNNNEIDALINDELNLKILSKKNICLNEKSTWLLETDDSKYILKTVTAIKDTNGIRKIIKIVISKLRRAISREIIVYEHFNNMRFEYFKYPKMIKGDRNRYLLLEFIPSNDGWERKNISADQIIRSLIEFNTCGINLKQSFFERIISDFRRKTAYKIFHWSITTVRRTVGVIGALKCIKILIMCTRTQKANSKEFTLHRDLIGHNNMLSSHDNKIYFCDFESIVSEKRWILNDIIDISLSLTLEIDKLLLQRYLELLEEKLYVDVYINVKEQVRIALLHRVIRRILSNNEFSKQNKQLWISFLKNTLLVDKEYEIWYEKNVGI